MFMENPKVQPLVAIQRLTRSSAIISAISACGPASPEVQRILKEARIARVLHHGDATALLRQPAAPSPRVSREMEAIALGPQQRPVDRNKAIEAGRALFFTRAPDPSRTHRSPPGDGARTEPDRYTSIVRRERVRLSQDRIKR